MRLSRCFTAESSLPPVIAAIPLTQLAIAAVSSSGENSVSVLIAAAAIPALAGSDVQTR